MEKSSDERRIEALEKELEKRQRDFDDLTMEMALSVSEFFQVLREITRGNFDVRASEDSGIEVMAELGKTINKTIANLEKSEAALRASEERFRNLAELIPVGVFEIGLDGRYRYVNREVARMTGYSVEEILGGVAPADLIADDDRERLQGILAGIAGGESARGVEYMSRRKDGTTFPSLGYGATVLEGGRPAGIRGIVVDITDRKRAEEERTRLEEQVQHSQKLESLGVLAGGIAHDFNNLLTGILGNSELAMRHFSRSSPGIGYLEDVVESADKAAELCRQMLAYSGKGKFVLGMLDLRKEIEDMMHLIKVLLPKKVDLSLNFPKSLPAIRGDGAQVRQVIMNLLINASEAISDEKGAVNVTIGTRDCDAGCLADTMLGEELEPGRYVYVEVRDTGCGMDTETIPRIFDPFFTTKFTGRGLGLSAVMGIVRGHKGAISVESDQKAGTVFTVLFPAQDEAPDERRESEMRPMGWKGSGKVLLVDDEATVRDVGSRMLKEMGFESLLAVDGEEGVRLFEENADEVVCVILDLTMPNMDGREAFERIRRISDTVPVILSSGYNEQKIVTEFTGRNLSAFIQKPYRLAEFTEKVKTAITVSKIRS